MRWGQWGQGGDTGGDRVSLIDMGDSISVPTSPLDIEDFTKGASRTQNSRDLRVRRVLSGDGRGLVGTRGKVRLRMGKSASPPVSPRPHRFVGTGARG